MRFINIVEIESKVISLAHASDYYIILPPGTSEVLPSSNEFPKQLPLVDNLSRI